MSLVIETPPDSALILTTVDETVSWSNADLRRKIPVVSPISKWPEWVPPSI